MFCLIIRHFVVAMMFIPVFISCITSMSAANERERSYIKEREPCENFSGNHLENLDCLFNFNVSVGYGIDRDDDVANGSITPSVSFDYKNFGFGFTYVHYLEEEKQQSYQPDFTYKFGYEDFDPNTISLTYANFGGNRLNPSQGERITRLEHGVTSLTYRSRFDDDVTTKLTGLDGYLSCSTSANWVPRYYDEDKNDFSSNQLSLSFGCSYVVWKGLFIRGEALFYPIADQQQSFNPDYTYGFGYNTYERNSLAIEVQNYAGNRWPGRRDRNEGSFSDGSIRLIYHLPF